MINFPLQYALNLLKLRDRTVGEIKDKMRLKKFSDDEIEKTISFLKEKDFLNDERFATNFIRNKQEFGSAGKYKIKFKLEQLKVDKQLICDKLEEIDDEEEKNRALELAQDWIQKKGQKNYSSKGMRSLKGNSSHLSLNNNYEKLGRFLVGKGFEVGIIREVLEATLKKNA